jgi:competence protein ComGC
MKKKAFTLVELLVVMLIATLTLSALFAILSSTFKLYDDTVQRSNPHNSELVFINSIAMVSRQATSMEVYENSLKIQTRDDVLLFDPAEYKISDVVFVVDNSMGILNIIIGGETYCINYETNS